MLKITVLKTILYGADIIAKKGIASVISFSVFVFSNYLKQTSQSNNIVSKISSTFYYKKQFDNLTISYDVYRKINAVKHSYSA